MAEIIIKKEQHECPPAVAAYIKELKAENARLEELYQKSVGVIAATDCKAKSIKQQKVCCTSNITDDEPQTIDAEPVKHAYWVDIKFSEGVFKDNDDSDDIGISITSAKCSLCHRYSDMLQQYSPKMPAYCSHCGAKMDGGAENA